MTASLAPESPREPLRLSVAPRASTPPLPRHAADRSPLAEPYPLGPSAKRAFEAIVLALCPPLPAPRTEALLARVSVGSRRLLRYMHPVVSRGLAAGLILLDWLAVPTVHCRLHRAPTERVRAALHRWSVSRLPALRLLIQGLRALVQSVYFDQDEVHTAIGYAPVPFQRRRIELRRRLLEPMRHAAE